MKYYSFVYNKNILMNNYNCEQDIILKIMSENWIVEERKRPEH